VIYVVTHDSIGVGEDGPTHQPIEHLASYRAMPNLLLFRPCDVVETAEAWELGIKNEKSPSLLVLSRQGLPCLRRESSENLSAKGGYVISKAEGNVKATIIATGSEVEIAVEAQKILLQRGIGVNVVSMPCLELFDRQPEEYRKNVLGTAPRIVVEAASPFGWDKYVAGNGAIVGLDGFGASAPGGELYKHFGLTADAVAKTVEKCIK
jgi:transketolase